MENGKIIIFFERTRSKQILQKCYNQSFKSALIEGNIKNDSASPGGQSDSIKEENEQIDSVSSGGQQDSTAKGKRLDNSASSGELQDVKDKATYSASSGELSDSKIEEKAEHEQTYSTSSEGQQDSTEIGVVDTDSASSGEQSVSKTKENERTDSATSTVQQDYKEHEEKQTDSATSTEQQDHKEQGKEQTDFLSSEGQPDSREIDRDSASSGEQLDSKIKEKEQIYSSTSTGLQDYKEQEKAEKEQTDSASSEGQQDSTVKGVVDTDSASSGEQSVSKTKGKEQTDSATSIEQQYHKEQDVLRSLVGLLSNIVKKQQSKPIEVQFFVPINTATTKDFSSNALEDLCGDILFKCSLSGIGNLSENSPLVVVCPICSRFEPDIDCAIDGIDWKKTFVVLLLHSGLKSSIPIITTASKLAHMEKYKNIVFIDVAYTIDEKLYQCQMNENAKDQLRSFVLDFTRPNLD